MTSTPTVIDNPARHQFEIDLGEGQFAFAKYALLPGAIRFYHTVVPESASRARARHGAGRRQASQRRGERGLKVIPVCPFFATYLKQHPDQQDLVAPEYRHLIED